MLSLTPILHTSIAELKREECRAELRLYLMSSNYRGGRNFRLSMGHQYEMHRQRDKTIWTLTKSGKYTIGSFYEQLRYNKCRVPWSRMVWSGKAPQKYKLILWLAVQSKLKTRELLTTRGMNLPSTSCALCQSGTDSCQHLFFLCEFTKKVWKMALLKLANTNREPKQWTDEVTWLRKVCMGRNRYSRTIQLVPLCTIYNVWLERNNRIFRNKTRDENNFIEIIGPPTPVEIVKKRKQEEAPQGIGNMYFYP